MRLCLEELQDCTGADQVDAASEAWEKVVKTVQETVKAQPFDAFTFKLLSEALPGFLTKSFSTQGQSTNQSGQLALYSWVFVQSFEGTCMRQRKKLSSPHALARKCCRS